MNAEYEKSYGFKTFAAIFSVAGIGVFAVFHYHSGNRKEEIDEMSHLLV